MKEMQKSKEIEVWCFCLLLAPVQFGPAFFGSYILFFIFEGKGLYLVNTLNKHIGISS